MSLKNFKLTVTVLLLVSCGLLSWLTKIDIAASISIIAFFMAANLMAEHWFLLIMLSANNGDVKKTMETLQGGKDDGSSGKSE